MNFSKKIGDFDRNRIGFTIALIATDFALYPILKDFKSVLPKNFFQPSFISFKEFFWIFNILLGLSIYLYAISYFGYNSFLKRTKIVGDWLYKITILTPILYFIYYILCFLINYDNTHTLNFMPGSNFATTDFFYNTITIVFLLIMAFVTGVIFTDIADEFNKRQRNHRKL